MNTSKRLLASVALSGFMLSGCVSKVTEESQHSGFLSNYDGLQQTSSASGKPVMRWVADGFDPGAYDTLVFNQLELYPAPKPNERVNLQTLQELQSLTSSSVKSALEQKYRVVPSVSAAPAGSRTLVMRAAITGVSASNQGMRWYEVLPVTAAAGAVSVAAGYRDQNTELYVEADLVDTATGKPVVKVVRKVFGATLENNSQVVTANDFKLAIRDLATDVRGFMQ